jgi:hypothetical protein
MTIQRHHPIDHLMTWNLALGLPFGLLIVGIMGWSYPPYSNAPSPILLIWAALFGSTVLALTPVKLYIPLKLTIAALLPFFIGCVIMLFALGDLDWRTASHLLLPFWIGFKFMKLYLCVPLVILAYISAINRIKPPRPY